MSTDFQRAVREIGRQAGPAGLAALAPAVVRSALARAAVDEQMRAFAGALEQLRPAFQRLNELFASPEVREKIRRTEAYHRRIGRPRSPLSSHHRAGSRANKHRRTGPTFASDRRGSVTPQRQRLLDAKAAVVAEYSRAGHEAFRAAQRAYTAHLSHVRHIASTRARRRS